MVLPMVRLQPVTAFRDTKKVHPHLAVLGKRVVFKGRVEHCQAGTGKKTNKSEG
jgi:hypothetical protein